MTSATDQIEGLRAESLKFPPNIRRKVNVALDGIEQAISATIGADADSVDMALGLLDDMRTGDRIAYDDYSRLHDAIAATLGGNENRVSERLRGVASDMRNIGASSMTPRELFAYWAREVDKAADLADFLVSMNPDGLPVGLTISEDGSLLNWRGENYVRQSALDGGECELAYGENDEGVDGWYTHCGGWFAATRKDGRMVHPLFCQLCGSKAVEQ